MNARHGFTLLEVLIALVILAVGVIAVMQLFPPALYQVRLAAERVPAGAWASKEFDVLRARGVPSDLMGRLSMGWPAQLSTATDIYADTSDARYLAYNIQPLGVPDVLRPMSQATQIYSMHRVTIGVPMLDGRYEKFVTYVSKY